MSNPIFQIELVNLSRLDIIIKGDRNVVIGMMQQAMESNPEAAEAIMAAATLYFDTKKKGKIIRL